MAAGDSLLQRIEQKLLHAEGAHHRHGEVPPTPAPRFGGGAVPSLPAHDRPLGELLRALADAYLELHEAAAAEGKEGAACPPRAARDRFDDLVAELKRSAQMRVARAASGAPPPSALQGAAHTAGQLHRAKIDMSVTYERALGDEMQRHLRAAAAAAHGRRRPWA